MLAIVVGLAYAWALVGLVVATAHARGRTRVPLAPAAGDPAKGVRYMFTTAMQPAHKESVALHQASFALGVALHAGLAAALVGMPLLIAVPRAPLVLRVPLAILAALGAVAAIALAVRRYRLPVVRALSVPEDYLVELLALLALVSIALAAIGRAPASWAAVPMVLLLVYLPAGKLRHMVFFFLARGDLGWRLGWRGALPATARREAR